MDFILNQLRSSNSDGKILSVRNWNSSILSNVLKRPWVFGSVLVSPKQLSNQRLSIGVTTIDLHLQTEFSHILDELATFLVIGDSSVEAMFLVGVSCDFHFVEELKTNILKVKKKITNLERFVILEI